MNRNVPIGWMLLVLAVMPAVADAAAPGEETQEPSKLSLRLKTSAHTGYAPLSVILSVDLLGTAPEDLGTCLLSEEWIGDIPSLGYSPKAKRTMSCVTTLENGKVPRSFQRAITLEEPGRYIYQVLLTPKGKRTVASKSIEIKAMRSRVQVKGTQSGS